MQHTKNRSPDDSERPPVKVALHAEHDGLPLLNLLLLIGPLTRELYGCLYSLGAGVHWKHHIIFEEGCDLLGERPETRVVKGPR